MIGLTRSGYGVVRSPHQRSNHWLVRLWVLLGLGGILVGASVGVWLVYGEDWALERLRLRAEKGDADAQYSYAMRVPWVLPCGGGAEEFEDALYYLKTAAQQGHVLAQAKYARLCTTMYGDEQEWHKEAFQWAKLAADRDNRDGAYLLAECYANGWGTATNFDDASRWYAQAAGQMHPGALFKLGESYMDKYKVDPSSKDLLEDAVGYYKDAAKNGHGDACLALGRLAEARSKDPAKVCAWYEKAVERGSEEACHVAGRWYEVGNGGHSDNEKAYYYFLIGSYAHYNAACRDSAERVANKLSPRQQQKIAKRVDRLLEGWWTVFWEDVKRLLPGYHEAD